MLACLSLFKSDCLCVTYFLVSHSFVFMSVLKPPSYRQEATEACSDKIHCKMTTVKNQIVAHITILFGSLTVLVNNIFNV